MDNREALELIRLNIEKGYGKRCKEEAFGCYTCLAWKAYDGIKLLFENMEDNRDIYNGIEIEPEEDSFADAGEDEE